RRRAEDALHVLGVVVAELQRVRDGELRVDDRAAREREEKAVAILGGRRAVRGEDLQVLAEDLGALDAPLVVGQRLRDRLLRLRLVARDLGLLVLPDRRGDEAGRADDEGREEVVIVLDEATDARRHLRRSHLSSPTCMYIGVEVRGVAG